ncbi:MAG: tetratricopeptide repeat protein [Candidatus Riflebacteria bacterium]|nr:tetratricopeptide repeat protein [Candidatus Riflebacteria bacterium]
MQPTSRQATIELDADRLTCTALGVVLASVVVAMTFAASTVSISLVKKGIPETLNTFVGSAERTFGRLGDAGFSELVMKPDVMGFDFANRIPTLVEASGSYSNEDSRSTLELTGSNLDCVRTLSIGAEVFTTESFRYNDTLGQITIVLKREPTRIADTVTIADDTGERSSRSIRWPADMQVFARPVAVASSTTKTPAATGSGSPGESEQARRSARLAFLQPLKAEVLTILASLKVELAGRLHLEFREQLFYEKVPSVFRNVLLAVVNAPSLGDAAKLSGVKRLLGTRLFRENYLNLDDSQMAWLVADTSERVSRTLLDPRGPEFILQEFRGKPVGAGTAAGDATPGGQPIQLTLRPAQYREVFRAEEPFRDCLANQQKLAAAAEAAIRKGELADGTDVHALVRGNYLPAVVICPAGGQYKLDAAGPLEVACSVHGNAARPSEEHRKFATLFGTYEKARDLITREGHSAQAIPMLEAELSRQPNNPYISYLLGRAYVETQNYERAHQLLKPLSDDSPSDLNYSYSGGYAFYAVGNTPQAHALFDRAARATYEGSREELSSRAEFYLLRDKAKWVARKALGRSLDPADDGPDAPVEKPLRFLDFKQLSEPEYPSQICLRGLSTMERALGPVLEAFLQPEMREKWAGRYQKYASTLGAGELLALRRYLWDLSKEYVALLPEVPPVCPDKGYLFLETVTGKTVLQCSAHHDLEPDAVVALDPDVPAWQVHAVNVLVSFLVRRKNPELDRCLTNQEQIEAAFSQWDDPRRVPSLDDLVEARRIGQKTLFCPVSRAARYRVERGTTSCRYHEAASQVQRRLAAWPLIGGGRR